MDRDQAIERLRALRNEAIALADLLSIPREQVDDWRSRTSATLEQVYGRDSSPVRVFSRVKFDDATIIDTAERVLRKKAADEGVDITSLKIPLPPAENALRRGLYEAADLLLSLTV